MIYRPNKRRGSAAENSQTPTSGGQQMQPNKEQNNVTPVMDIQRPTQTPPSPQARPTSVFTPSSQQTRPATMEYTCPRMDTSTVRSISTISQQDIAMNKPKKSKKGLIISLFVLLFVGLSGAELITTWLFTGNLLLSHSHNL